jgi:hypothetical protein
MSQSALAGHALPSLIAAGAVVGQSRRWTGGLFDTHWHAARARIAAVLASPAARRLYRWHLFKPLDGRLYSGHLLVRSRNRSAMGCGRIARCRRLCLATARLASHVSTLTGGGQTPGMKNRYDTTVLAVGF